MTTHRTFPRTGLLAGITVALTACSPAAPYAIAPASVIAIAPANEPLEPSAGPSEKQLEAIAEQTEALRKKIAQFSPAVLTADISALPDSEKQALKHIIAASKLLEPIFERQASSLNVQLAEQLAEDESELGQLQRTYFRIMRGPWDRQAKHARFVGEHDYYPGAGFYPRDLSAKSFDAYVKANPAQAKALTDLFTVVSRQGNKLVATPYNQAYAEWLKPAAAHLKEAAAATKNASLATYLTSRAKAFLDDDYYQSDMDWMDLDSRVEVTIGPYEVYEDQLKGYKAAYESFVTINDPEASGKLTKYKQMLPDMEKNLPIDKSMRTKRGSESPIRVVDLVYSSGDARKSVQTIAFNLPNDERVRKAKGAKKVLLRNIIEKKFDLIMRPIAKRILVASQLPHLSAKAFFNQTLFHELSHSLGPAHTTKDGKKVEVRVALASSYSAIEECKADVMGAYNIIYMVKEGHFPKEFKVKALASYFAGLFRSIRFGVTEAHGKGAAVQINRFLEEGAATFNAETGRFTVDFDKLEASIERLTRDLCVLQHRGDKQAADQLLNTYGVMSAPMTQALDSVKSVPVDLRPIYPVAGEK